MIRSKSACKDDITCLERENQILKNELNKVEDLLSTARAERDELIIKYKVIIFNFSY
jgi:hypothetical protein